MKILIVDDERLARNRLQALIEELGVGEVVGEASNGREAVSAAYAYQPDVVLLDIRMPGMDGIQAASQLALLQPTPPMIIFTTAYGDHALEAFDRQAIAYLLKPIQKERLVQALKRASVLIQNKPSSLPPPTARSHISVNIRGQLHLIPVNQIYYFLAEQKYTIVRWVQGEALLSETLKKLEDEFAGEFLRIHRRTLVAIVHIASLFKDKQEHSYITLKQIPNHLEVSRRHLPDVRKILKDMHIACD